MYHRSTRRGTPYEASTPRCSGVQPSGHRASRSAVPGALGPLANASTVGPAPEITAGTPSARSASTRASESGIAARRWSWCR